MLPCLGMLLTSCGKREISVRAIPTPPASLLVDCPERPVDIKTNRDIALKVVSLKEDLGLCNADKAALRAWVDGVNK